MRKVKCVVLLFGLLFFATDKAGADDDSKSKLSEDDKKAIHAYKLDRKTKFLFEKLLFDDFKELVSGGESVSSVDDLGLSFALSTDEYQEQYEENAASADLEFKKKTGAIYGEVGSIGKGFLKNDYYISFQRDDIFHLQARMDKKHIAYLSTLEAEDEISLICQGDGGVLRISKVKGCVPSEEWLAKNFKKAAAKFQKKSDEFSALKLIMLFYAELLSSESVCFKKSLTSANDCIEELKRYPSEKITAVADEVSKKVGFDAKKLFKQKENAE